MAQRKELLKLEIITDCDTGMYRMGEIDTLVEGQISTYIQQYGETAYEEIIRKACEMITVANTTIREQRFSKIGRAQSNEGFVR